MRNKEKIEQIRDELRKTAIDRFKRQVEAFMEFSDSFTFELERIEEGKIEGLEPFKREMEIRLKVITGTLKELKEMYPKINTMDLPELTHKNLYMVMMTVFAVVE